MLFVLESLVISLHKVHMKQYGVAWFTNLFQWRISTFSKQSTDQSSGLELPKLPQKL